MPEFHIVNAQLYDKQFDNRIRKREGDYHVGRTYHTTAGTLDERCRRIGGYARDLPDIPECPSWEFPRGMLNNKICNYEQYHEQYGNPFDWFEENGVRSEVTPSLENTRGLAKMLLPLLGTTSLV